MGKTRRKTKHYNAAFRIMAIMELFCELILLGRSKQIFIFYLDIL